ncbi:MAG: alkaline phosphatase family protein [Streptosporangiaceae bacterium]
MSADGYIANLEKVDHIVVLMMENRSFDHMLGYLSLTGVRADIDGLRQGLANEYAGRSYPAHHLTTTEVEVDPDHSASAVDLQIGDGRMDGFVASLAKTLADRGTPGGDPSEVIGYYDAADVPVYDHLAEEFLVCDRWFSSVPGATWPNRLYSQCGSAAGSRDDLPPHRPPMYDKPSFVRHLDAHDISWRWYSFDTPTLRLADAHYTVGHHHRFGYFSKAGLTWKARIEIRIDARAASFLEDAASGSLPAVSWIDPAFTSFNPLGFHPNDDHAPADIRDGQDLVLAVYDALATSPNWERSLLVITYDEHGGFYDHVPPPRAADDHPEMFGRYGVRVPAIIVSPWVEPRSVSSTVFDHTSIIKSILLRFCPQALEQPLHAKSWWRKLQPGQPKYLGARVAHAAHLGEVLTCSSPRPAPERDSLVMAAAARAAEQEKKDDAAENEVGAAEHTPTDLQQRFLAAAHELTKRGHPAGMP